MPTNEKKVPDDFHALYDGGFRTSRGMAAAVAPTETAGHQRLTNEIPDVVVDYDEGTNMPNRIASRNPNVRLCASSTAPPEEVVTQFIRDRCDLWNLSDEDVDTVKVLSVSRKGLNAVRLIQQIEGKEVFNADVTVGLSSDNEIIAVSGQLFPGAGAAAPSARAAAKASEADAIALAASDLTGAACTAQSFSPAPSPPDSGNYRFMQYSAADGEERLTFERPIRIKDVMFPMGEGNFIPAYYMELWIKGIPAFAYVIDAVDQPDEILYRKNLTSGAFRYSVHNTGDALLRPEDGPAPGTPHPTGIPDGFQAPTISETVIDTDGLLSGDPWLPPGATTTSGNNCIAYADLTDSDAPGSGNPFGNITSVGEFGHTFDHSKDASDSTNLQASLVGMFFHVNWLHDRWYEAGFDEASGNAQRDNFGRGGLGGDPILAEGNDASGTDNANMSTPADGASPRMQMFEFVGVPAGFSSRTSNHEALITFHEMGHYITNRLIGNSSGIDRFHRQSRAMGEGWGDFFAICMTSQATDNFALGAFPAGGWTDITDGFSNNYYFSIRRYPFSADMNKNPLTFRHISSGVALPSGPPRRFSGPNNEEHNAGEVWCCALWEVFVNLTAKHGHDEGEQRVLRYVIGGLKLTPNFPTFTQARDAIISATDADDLPEVWAGFAKRGMGDGAVSPASISSSLTGVVESFNVP